jgi:hypothetical protein
VTPRCRNARGIRSLILSSLTPQGGLQARLEGMRGGAPKSADLWCPWLLLGVTAGASRRATCAHLGALPRFALLERMVASRHLSACSFRGVFCATHRAPLSVAGYGRAVSQLLAGTPSGPGGSPDAARVQVLRDLPAGAAPRPASRRLMNAPFIGRGGRMIGEVWSAGISRGKGRSPSPVTVIARLDRAIQ